MTKTKTGPVIGISMSLDKSGLVRPGVDYSFIRREYGQEVRSAGGQPIFLDSTIHPDVAAELCDGIVISGGADIQPELYGHIATHSQATEPVERTLWEQHLIDACDTRGLPILGICYGLQLLNIHYGGTLFQDIQTEQGTTADHGRSGGSVMQRVCFGQDFLGFQKGDAVETAHRHHQAINKLARGFNIVASTEDGIVEAIAGRGHYGIQWHAESDGTAPAIYGAFIALCSGQRLETGLSPLPEIA